MDAMKVAKIIPIHKSGEKNVFNDYRLVSIISQFSKILERLFCNRLENYIEKNKILNDSQYGFRNHRSTAMASETKFFGIYIDFRLNWKNIFRIYQVKYQNV